MENLFSAWQEFKRGKSKKFDVQQFEFCLEDNIFQLHNELKKQIYKHSYYTPFFVRDPKLRKIHKAIVKDRVLHHAIFRVLYPIFDKIFIADSYSCRDSKGAHKAVNRLQKFAGKVSKNGTWNCFALQCDVKKFFDSIDHKILLALLKKKIQNKKALWLINEIIDSFFVSPGVGLPLGNITSQLFANVYLNQFDQFIKHQLRLKCFIRYCDDFIILSESERFLENLISLISNFLKENLKLEIHPNKIFIKTLSSGVDFLGYVNFSHYRILRVKTKKRMFAKLKIKNKQRQIGEITQESFNQTLQSYLGILKHCNGHKLKLLVLQGFVGVW